MIIKYKEQSYIVSFDTDEDYKKTEGHDKYGRIITREWREHTVTAKVQKAFEDFYKSATIYIGKAFCGYRDKFKPFYGRYLALTRALKEIGLTDEEIKEFVEEARKTTRLDEAPLPPKKPRLYPKVTPFKGVKHGGLPVVPPKPEEL